MTMGSSSTLVSHPILWVLTLDETSTAGTILQDAHCAVSGGSLRRYVMACYLDGALFANHANRPALTYGPLAENIHGIDERVSLSSLKRVTQTIALFAANWCGVESA
ncbi:hypothetical protein [Roseibium sp. TrichSKD4]|uniref:hypothetical protein n=1 Tax=Roseibium sp. TrichSKD4 TaxID=744980 RepID=UPI001AD8D551|nr:hypothetical protein [Roseibium sp. TrichSKD4]